MCKHEQIQLLCCEHSVTDGAPSARMHPPAFTQAPGHGGSGSVASVVGASSSALGTSPSLASRGHHNPLSNPVSGSLGNSPATGVAATGRRSRKAPEALGGMSVGIEASMSPWDAVSFACTECRAFFCQ